LAHWACLAVVLDVLTDSWPPVVAPNVFRGLLWAKMSQHFVRLQDNDLSQSSFILDDRWYAQHGSACSISSIHEAVYDFEVLMVVDILKDLITQRISQVATLDILEDGAVTLHSRAEVWEVSQ